MTPAGAWLAAALAVTCGCRDRDGDATPPAAPRDDSPAVAPEPGAATAVWQTRVPDTPGTAVLTWTRGPAMTDRGVRVGSSAVGVATLDANTGAVVAHDPTAGDPAPRPGDDEPIATMDIDGDAVALARTHIARGDRWSYRFPDRADLGVAGPVRAGAVVAFARDDTLAAVRVDTGALGWEAAGRYAYATGAVAAGPDGTLRAVALDGGVGPALVSAETGERISRGAAVDAPQVVAAAWSATGALAVAIRRDTTMYDDAVVAFAPDGTLAWQWSLPRPDEPRADPIGVAIDGGAVFVFYDGRFAARFDL